jgi:HAD superfamily hydrolase (TIGR01459 family)
MGAGGGGERAFPKRVRGVSDLAEYDTFLLDQFGVMHDGRNAYAHALHAVEQLHALGKSLVVLSNSGRRSDETLKKLSKLGFDASHFAGAVTSGETTHEALRTPRREPWFKALGRRCMNVNWADRGAAPLDACLYGIELVQSVAEADFILAHGMEALSGATPKRVSLDDLQSLLREAATRGLPLIIANPDVVTVDTTHLVPMPGQLGVWYSQMAGHGDIVLMGKPDKRIYEAASLLVGPNPGRILAVGDSLAHDIKGASAAGIDSLFIVNGIHEEEFTPWSDDTLVAMAQEHCDGRLPTFVASEFAW